MAQNANSHWWTPATTVLSFLAGVLLALGHHLFYKSLSGKSTATDYVIMGGQFKGQQLNIAIGTAFAFFVKAAFVLAVSIAYYQIFWRKMKRDSKLVNPPTLGHVDTAYSGLNNIISLLTAPVWYRNPLLFLVAAVAWLLPIASIITPATLSVTLREDFLSYPLEDVPQIDFSNFNFMVNMGKLVDGEDAQFYQYEGPTQSLRNAALNVAMQKAIPPIDVSSLHSDSSWTLNFNGPSLKCDSIGRDESLEIQDNIMQYLQRTTCNINSSSTITPTFLAWYSRPSPGGNGNINQDITPYSESDEFEPNGILETHGIHVDGLRERNAVVHVVAIPGALLDWTTFCSDDLGANVTMLACRLHNSTYQARFNHRNGTQKIHSEITERGPTVGMVAAVAGPTTLDEATDNCTTFHRNADRLDAKCLYDTTLLPQLAYQSAMQAFTDFIVGEVTFDRSDLAGTSKIRDTALLDTKELAYITDYGRLQSDDESGQSDGTASYLQSYLANSPTPRPAPSNASLAETIEVMFQNFTIGLMGSPAYRANYSSPNAPPRVPVLRTIARTVYVYRADRLWASYGAAAFCTLVSVLVGVFATLSSGSSYGNAFSTIFRVARAAELSVEVRDGDSDGKTPLPGYLAKATLILDTEGVDVARRNVERGKNGDTGTALLNDEGPR